METYEDMFVLQANSQNTSFIQNPYDSTSFNITKLTHASLTNGASQ
jgi:hypothetical protein